MGARDWYSGKIVRACAVIAGHILDDRGEPPLWPMPIVKNLWYLSKFFPREVHRTIERLREGGIGEDEIAQLFLTPTRLTYVFNQAEFPIEGLTAEQGGALFDTFMDYVASYRRRDVYCDSMTNVLWSDDTVAREAGRHDFVSHRQHGWDELCQLLGRFNGVMWLYTEFIHAAKHPYSHEFHGPYRFARDEILVVREYYDLKPIAIWPFLSRVPHTAITTFEIYDAEADIGFDFLNHSYASVSLPSHLRAFFVGVGDEQRPVASYDTLWALMAAYQDAIGEGSAAVAGYTDVDWLERLLELHYYYLKPHKDVLGEDWRPPKELYEFVRAVEPDDKYAQFMDLVGRAMRTPSEELIGEIRDLHVSNIYSGPESRYLDYSWE